MGCCVVLLSFEFWFFFFWCRSVLFLLLYYFSFEPNIRETRKGKNGIFHIPAREQWYSTKKKKTEQHMKSYTFTRHYTTWRGSRASLKLKCTSFQRVCKQLTDAFVAANRKIKIIHYSFLLYFFYFCLLFRCFLFFIHIFVVVPLKVCVSFMILKKKKKNLFCVHEEHWTQVHCERTWACWKENINFI